MCPSVLLVDDDPIFRTLARRMLEALGLMVVGEAATVAAAVAAARTLRPEAALVDIRLPDGDGVALARELSALPWRPEIILTSTDPDAASAEDVLGSGANAFIAKDELPRAQLPLLLSMR
jgi:DNA-binding NarL/FixJ family response regulator